MHAWEWTDNTKRLMAVPNLDQTIQQSQLHVRWPKDMFDGALMFWTCGVCAGLYYQRLIDHFHKRNGFDESF